MKTKGQYLECSGAATATHVLSVVNVSNEMIFRQIT